MANNLLLIEWLKFEICLLKFNFESIVTPRSLNSSTHFISISLNRKDKGILMRLFVTTTKKVFAQFISNLL